MMVRILALGILLAGIYWYWSGPYQESRTRGPAAQLKENARQMQKCVRREQSITAGAGMVGASGGAENPEEFCAEQLKLYNRDGKWYSLD